MSEMVERTLWILVDGEMVQMPRIEALKHLKKCRKPHLKSRKDWFAKFGEEDPHRKFFEAFYDDVDDELMKVDA